jgi:hypothetical protein
LAERGSMLVSMVFSSFLFLVNQVQESPPEHPADLAAEVMGQIIAEASEWDGCFFRCEVSDPTQKPPYHRTIENWIQGGANGSDEECCKMAEKVCGRVRDRLVPNYPNITTKVSYCSVYDGTVGQ